MTRRIVFFTLGTPANGMGHVVRCITLANQLSALGVRVEFVTLQNTPGWKRLTSTPYPVRGVSEVTDMLDVYSGGVDAAVIDVEHGPDRAMLERARALFPCVINIGGVGWAMKDPAALDDLVDLQIYQSVLVDAPPHPRRLSGVEYMIINPGYAECVANYRGGHVVVSMGGTDPHDLTPKALDALMKSDCKVKYPISKSLAESFYTDPNTGRLREEYRKWPGRLGYESRIGDPDLLWAFKGASLSLIQLGMTAYESMAAGVPPLLVNLSEDHQRTSVELERLGCAINLGLWNEFDPAAVRDRVEWLLARPEELRRMGEAGRRLVDGRGAARVAEKIMEFVK